MTTSRKHPDFVPGDVRTYVLRLSGGGGLWTDDLESILAEIEFGAEEDDLVFDREDAERRLRNMQPGDPPYELGEWSVEVHMVDRQWLDSLPEHPGW